MVYLTILEFKRRWQDIDGNPFRIYSFLDIKKAGLSRAYIISHEEFKQLRIILEGKIEGEGGMVRKKIFVASEHSTHIDTLIYQAHNREQYAVTMANLSREGT